MQLLILLSILGLIFSNLDDSNDDSTDEEEGEHEIAGNVFNQYGEISDSDRGSGFNRYGELE